MSFITSDVVKPSNNKPLLIKKSFMALALLSSLGLAACQPSTEQSAANKAPDNSTQSSEVAQTSNTQTPTPMSAEAAAQVKHFEAEFVNKMLDLQQSQQAEYEALQAADAAEQEVATKQTDASTSETVSDAEPQTVSKTGPGTGSEAGTGLEAAATDPDITGITGSGDAQAATQQEAEPSQELPSLPLVDLAIKPPEQLTPTEISSRYNVAMQSLYLEEGIPLPAQAIDTLLNIATLTPGVFHNTELAEHLVAKSPALARMLKQYQAWDQIERQQSAELEALKQSQIEAQQKQQAEFDALAKEFNDKIAAYDEQIKNYEQKLKTFN
ncbi:hypothetical protein [Psychrobacter sanguinis]|uniref:Uncharacterized protein n=1 Tax=Psychrobacter sanguinis TaxID=861445 RepID=A0A844LYZ0_9GAMM|nr:hypothetical protein [Psychrobacter sanguinis]MUG31568.1 hypothetical protein [Psychrobacter sanguinis]